MRLVRPTAVAALVAVMAAQAVPVTATIKTVRTTGSAAAAAVMPAGAIGHWRLDENGGSVAGDSSGHGHDGVVAGPEWVAGRSGAALRFAGDADRVTIPDAPSLRPSSVTLAAWVRASGSPGRWRPLIFKGVTDCVGSSFILKASESGGLVFGIYDGTTNVFSPDAGTEVWDGDWHLVVGTYDRSRLRLFVDGDLVGATETTIPIEYDLPDGTDLVIGHPVNLCGDTAPQFRGDIDDVRIWDRALSVADVARMSDRSVKTRSIKVSRTTLYPVRDGYVDTVTFSGILDEPISTTIRVKDRSGRVVRQFSLSRRQGRYSVTWNGKKSNGSLVAAGTYRVESRFRDQAGNSATVTRSLKVSRKRLVWRTASQTKAANRFSSYGSTLYADVNTWACDRPGCVYLFGNVTSDQLAYVRYDFVIPRAIRYSTIRFSALGEVNPQGITSGPATLSIFDWSDRVERGRRRTGKRYAWYSTSVSGSAFVSSSGRVRAWVTAYGLDGGNWDVAKVRLTYRYAVLR